MLLLKECNDDLIHPIYPLSCRRLERFPGESAFQSVQKACLARFLPSIARDALHSAMKEMDFEQSAKEGAKSGFDSEKVRSGWVK